MSLAREETSGTVLSNVAPISSSRNMTNTNSNLGGGGGGGQKTSASNPTSNSLNTSAQLSPFDVVLQEQQKHQITRKIAPKMKDSSASKSIKIGGSVSGNASQINEAVKAVTNRHSNPMGQIKKLQIVSLAGSSSMGQSSMVGGGGLPENNGSASIAGGGQGVFKIKRSQIIVNSKIGERVGTGQANHLRKQESAGKSDVAGAHVTSSGKVEISPIKLKDASELKFKKQFSRVSTGAINDRN